MEYLVYCRDRPGTGDLRMELVEQHWSFMDRYAATMIARGPTLAADGESATGSLHIVDLPDLSAARDFAYTEPNYRAGVYDSVLLCGFRNVQGRTMWDFTAAVPGRPRFLVLTYGPFEPIATPPENLIVYGRLLTLEDAADLGAAALLEADSLDEAIRVLPAPGDTRVEAHPWRFGGRPPIDSAD